MFIFAWIRSHVVRFIALRLEWIKARARKLRWQEELELLPEEARRAIVFFNAKATEWERCASQRRGSVCPEILEGLIGYAYRQAGLMRQLALSGQRRWSKSTDVSLSGLQPLPKASSGDKGRTNITRTDCVLDTGDDSSPGDGRDTTEGNKEAAEGENEGDDGDDDDDCNGPDDSDTEGEEQQNNFTTWLEGGNTD